MRFAKLFAAVIAVAMTGFGAFADSVTSQPLVDTQWAKDHLSDDRIVFIDLRNKIDGGNYETWLEGHVPGRLCLVLVCSWPMVVGQGYCSILALVLDACSLHFLPLSLVQ